MVLLEHLYRISLEEPRYWAMWIGLPVESSNLLDVRIDHLCSYIYGYRQANENEKEASAFFDWLIDKGEFPPQGWTRKYLADCNNEHIAAIQKFWGFLHEYLLELKPEWIIEMNSQVQPSRIVNGGGIPQSPDIRNAAHMKVFGIAAPTSS